MDHDTNIQKSIHEVVSPMLVRKFKKTIIPVELFKNILKLFNLGKPPCKKQFYFRHRPKRPSDRLTSESTLSFTLSDSYWQEGLRHAFKPVLSRAILERQFSKDWKFRTWIGSLYFPGILTHMKALINPDNVHMKILSGMVGPFNIIIHTLKIKVGPLSLRFLSGVASVITWASKLVIT